MEKVLVILMIFCLMIGCSAPSGISQKITSVVSTSSITSDENEPILTGADLYMKCFNEGKYDIYNLKIGDPIQYAIDEFGASIKEYYGLGGYCYTYNDVVISFAIGDGTYANRVLDIDIIGEGITAYGITTGKSTIEDVKKILGEPKHSWHYTYESAKTEEEPGDAGEQYLDLCYNNQNMDLWCSINFYFENDVLTVISLSSISGFY